MYGIVRGIYLGVMTAQSQQAGSMTVMAHVMGERQASYVSVPYSNRIRGLLSDQEQRERRTAKLVMNQVVVLRGYTDILSLFSAGDY